MKLFVALLLVSLVAGRPVMNNDLSGSLGPYHVSDVTVSGLSSGAFMAVQLHVAFSSFINGSAVFAGGPFYCAQGNLIDAEYKCMKTYEGLPNMNTLLTYTKTQAKSGHLDDLSNLSDDRVFLFSGADDTVVDPKVMQALQTYYGNLVSPSNIATDFTVKAEHCFPTLDYGEVCSRLSSPYIGKCDYDGAAAAFTTLYGTLNPQVAVVDSNLQTFDQKPFDSSATSSLDSTGYIYVPTACANGSVACHLHFTFHGCEQNQKLIGNDWVTKTGFNGWAESNNIIVVYPYVKQSYFAPSNPNGCWDWWGYTDGSYALKSGVQMQFVYNLYKAITGASANVTMGLRRSQIETN
eukprot:c4871_g1_i1.p1 GENE.c4871_g1_i1~~c4871_g1_i1.p1  ORF type:complete len:350 (-),score=72.97 c4871_g1_i1:189-1238(-)